MPERVKPETKRLAVALAFLVTCGLLFAGPAGRKVAAQLDLSVFRKKGASEEEQSKDRYECHRFAVQVTGFDPAVRPSDDSPPMRPKDAAELKAQETVERRKQQMKYNDALSQCMKGRGYTIAEH